MFGNEKNLLEIEEALSKQRKSLGLEQIVCQVQNLNLCSLQQQCMSIFNLDLNFTPAAHPCGVDSATGSDGSCIAGDDVAMETEEDFQPGSSSHSDGKTNAEETGILDIPVQAFLHILQYLDAKDICCLSATCQQCHCFCSDQLLWKSVLDKDMAKWSEVSNGTYPTNFTSQDAQLHYKDIYMRCHPEKQRDQAFNFSSIPRLLWSYLPHPAPLVVMFGPGLESDTSSIVRKLITGHGSDIIKVMGIFPAKARFQGLGSGFELLVNNKSRIRLVVLYSAAKKEREAARGANDERLSKLIKRIEPDPNSDGEMAQQGSNRGNDGEEGRGARAEPDEDFLNFEPKEHVKSMCGTVGGFIFVVNASQQLEQGACAAGRPELFAFMNSKWTPERKPLLVLSSIATSTTPRLPCVKVADQLSLSRLQRPWKVVDCDVSSLKGVSEGVEWLVGAAQKV